LIKPLEALEVGRDLTGNEGSRRVGEHPQLVVESLGDENLVGHPWLVEERSSRRRPPRRCFFIAEFIADSIAGVFDHFDSETARGSRSRCSRADLDRKST